MRISRLLLASIFLPLLAGCGSSDNNQVAEGGIGGTGVSQGKVSGYGSIFVNGVEFDTDSAVFVIEEEQKDSYTQDDIKLGMVVKVSGDNDGTNGTASKVEYSDLVDGIITAPPQLDANGVGTLEVMGQTVHVDRTTVFDVANGQDILIGDLVADDIVEVSGFSDGSGTIYATRVEFKGPTGSMELKGIVSDLTVSTFSIGNLTIDYSQDPSLPDGAPQAGWYVEVTGKEFTTSGDFLATEVALEGDGDLLVANDDDQVELEGVVTTPLYGDIFTLNGQPVSVANITLDTAQIVVGRELTAAGDMLDGTLIATAIEFEASESELQEIASKAMEITAVELNSGTLTLLGRSITVTSSTVMEDESAGGDDQTFNLNEILVDEYVKVDVYDDGSGLVAVKLERDDTPDPLTHEIEGVVEAVNVGLNADRILVLGIEVDIFATGKQPAVGDRVKISGEDYDGDVLWALSLEVDD